MVFFEKSSVSSPADLEYLVNCYKKTVADEVMLRTTGGSGHVLLEALRVGGKHIFDLAACAGAVEQRLPAGGLGAVPCGRGNGRGHWRA